MLRTTKNFHVRSRSAGGNTDLSTNTLNLEVDGGQQQMTSSSTMSVKNSNLRLHWAAMHQNWPAEDWKDVA